MLPDVDAKSVSLRAQFWKNQEDEELSYLKIDAVVVMSVRSEEDPHFGE